MIVQSSHIYFISEVQLQSYPNRCPFYALALGRAIYFADLWSKRIAILIISLVKTPVFISYILRDLITIAKVFKNFPDLDFLWQPWAGAAKGSRAARRRRSLPCGRKLFTLFFFCVTRARAQAHANLLLDTLGIFAGACCG